MPFFETNNGEDDVSNYFEMPKQFFFTCQKKFIQLKPFFEIFFKSKNIADLKPIVDVLDEMVILLICLMIYE